MPQVGKLPKWAWIAALGVGLLVAFIVLRKTGGADTSQQQAQPSSQPTSDSGAGSGAGAGLGGGDIGTTTPPVVSTLTEFPILPPPQDATPWGGSTSLPQWTAPPAPPLPSFNPSVTLLPSFDITSTALPSFTAPSAPRLPVWGTLSTSNTHPSGSRIGGPLSI